MNIINHFISFIHYLIHPFKSHEQFLHPERFEDEDILRLSAYESLTMSWAFVIINGIFRIILLNFIIVLFLDLISDSALNLSGLIDIKKIPSYNFVVLSSLVDIIFYPLFGIFIIQFWEFVFKMYGKLLGDQGDLHQKSQDILSVYFSSSILKIIPILGAPIQSIAKLVLMYAGLRKQLNSSPVLSVCIILTPYVFMLGLACLFMLVFLLIS